ncbi:MAG: EAL domain-containing protein [Actinomycetales bacterium]|nr:EAL domain-containing protein [Actinomycetales bacterium]
MTETGQRMALVMTTGFEGYQRQIVRGILPVLAPHGLTLVVNSFNSTERGGLPRSVTEVLRAVSPYGVIGTSCISTQDESELAERLRTLRIPTVRVGAKSADVTSIRSDDRAGMQALMTHLLDERGIRHPAFVRGIPHQPDAIQREQVFREELAARGIPVDEDLVIDGFFWHEVTYRELRTLLQRRRDMDAVVASNDQSALGALEALADEGLRVPDDVLVTGFDNDVFALHWPRLTTVDPQLERQGMLAAERLLTEVAGADPVDEILVAPQLLVRASTGMSTGSAEEQLPAAVQVARSARDLLATRDALWALSCATGPCTTLEEVAATLSGGHLLRLGITRCFLAEFVDGPRRVTDVVEEPGPELLARLVLDYRDRRAWPLSGESFPVGRLLPPELRHELRSDMLTFQPLIAGDRELGYVLLEQSDLRGLVSDGLRMDLGRTLDALFSNQILRDQAEELRETVVELQKEGEERRRVEAQLSLSATALDQATEGVVVVDAHGRVLSMNPAFSSITGYSPTDLVGRSVDVLWPPGEGADTLRLLRDSVLEKGHWEGEIGNRRKGGEEFLARVTISSVGTTGEAVDQFVVTCVDVSEIRRKDEHIQHLAFHDQLTGLANRDLLTDRLTQAVTLAQRQGASLGLVFADLNRFKTINDSYGHEVGNAFLRETAVRLRHCLRDSDTVARVGGDEFVAVLTTGLGVEHYAAVARRLLDHLSQPVVLDGHTLRVGASVGIASYPGDGDSAAELMKHAEAALHSAKSSGGSTFRFFRPEMTEQAQQQLQLEMELRDAVENGGLELFYQPKIDLRDGGLRGAEALVRWRHPQRGLLLPMEFIPLAEERGVICDLGTWVLREACRQSQAWRQAHGRTVEIAVNISVAQARQRDLVRDVLDACAAHGVSPTDLEVELTESGIMENLREISPTFVGLRDIGVTVAVDDFGTGYSGFAYLRELPADVLKIDRSFIMHLEDKPLDRKILNTIVTLGRDLDLSVVAEGVETEYQSQLLVSYGCQIAQGYLYDRPLPAEQFSAIYLTEDRPDDDALPRQRTEGTALPLQRGVPGTPVAGVTAAEV